MRTLALWSAPVLALTLVLPASAQKVGTRVPGLPLVGFVGTPAASFDDYVGRAVLLEYFAHW